MKIKDLIDKNVYAEDSEIGKITDIEIDPEEWKVTHLEIRLTKEAAKSLLGAKLPIRNKLAVSALKKGIDCCTGRGIEIKVSYEQLKIYLRPP